MTNGYSAGTRTDRIYRIVIPETDWDTSVYDVSIRGATPSETTPEDEIVVRTYNHVEPPAPLNVFVPRGRVSIYGRPQNVDAFVEALCKHASLES